MSRKDHNLKPKSKNHHSFTSEEGVWVCDCNECREFMNPSKHDDEKSEGTIRGYYKANGQPSTNEDYENISDWPPILPSALDQRILPRGGARSRRTKSQLSVPTVSGSKPNVSMVHLQSGRIKRDDDTDSVFDNEMVRRNYRCEDPFKMPKKNDSRCELEVNQLQPVNFDNYENIGISSKNIPPSYRYFKEAPKSGKDMKENSEKANDTMNASEQQRVEKNAIKSLPSAPNNMLANSVLTTFAPMSTQSSNANCTGVCDLLKNLPDFKLDNGLGKIEKLIAIQIIAALILVVLSLTLSVTGSKIPSAMFSSAILVIVQLLPAIGCLLLKSQHLSFVFRMSTQMCTYFNVFSSIISWTITSDSRSFILLAVATLQYGSFCLLNYYEYKEKMGTS